MFPHGYFASGYFAPTYFPPVEDVTPVIPSTGHPPRGRVPIITSPTEPDVNQDDWFVMLL